MRERGREGGRERERERGGRDRGRVGSSSLDIFDGLTDSPSLPSPLPLTAVKRRSLISAVQYSAISKSLSARFPEEYLFKERNNYTSQTSSE